VGGVGVYTNLSKRNMVVKLTASPALKGWKGKLKVQYTAKGDSKPFVYAESELVMN